MRQSVRKRMFIFVVVSVLAVGYSGMKYARITDMVIPTTYTVMAELPDSGGIFKGAEVTYRGVPVGQIGDVTLSDDGVNASLLIDKDTRIPADVDADVHNRSAVGEQYVNLVPRSSTGPLLAGGDRIARNRTSTPLQEDVVIKAVDDLATSIPLDDTRTVVTELGKAFRGTGPDLQRLLDGSDQFVAQAAEHLPQTIALLKAGNTVMATQNAQASSIKSFADDLARFTGTVADRDKDLRTLIDDGPGFASEMNKFIISTDKSITPLLSNLTILAQIGATHIPHIEQALVALPWSVTGVAKGGRHDRANFVSASLQDPPECHGGYLPPSEWRSAHDFSPMEPDYSVRCTDTDTSQRGSHWAPGPTR